MTVSNLAAFHNGKGHLEAVNATPLRISTSLDAHTLLSSMVGDHICTNLQLRWLQDCWSAAPLAPAVLRSGEA